MIPPAAVKTKHKELVVFAGLASIVCWWLVRASGSASYAPSSWTYVFLVVGVLLLALYPLLGLFSRLSDTSMADHWGTAFSITPPSLVLLVALLIYPLSLYVEFFSTGQGEDFGWLMMGVGVTFLAGLVISIFHLALRTGFSSSYESHFGKETLILVFVLLLAPFISHATATNGKLVALPALAIIIALNIIIWRFSVFNNEVA